MAGLEAKHYSVHKLRHTAATLMYQSGKVDVRVLKDILGHEQLNTTQIYTHVSNKNMEDAMEQNPLADFRPAEASEDTENDT
jgi:site-specific recombinase XerD